MRRRALKLVLGAVLAAGAATGGAAYRGPAHRSGLSLEARVAPPLADPALVPGIARCTSDGACLVTDATGTHAGTRFALR